MAEKQGQRQSETKPCEVKRRRCACCGSVGAAVWFGFAALAKKAAAALWQMWLETVFHSAYWVGFFAGRLGWQ